MTKARAYVRSLDPICGVQSDERGWHGFYYTTDLHWETEPSKTRATAVRRLKAYVARLGRQVAYVEGWIKGLR